jgi:hypothetical protein
MHPPSRQGANRTAPFAGLSTIKAYNRVYYPSIMLQLHDPHAVDNGEPAAGRVVNAYEDY